MKKSLVMMNIRKVGSRYCLVFFLLLFVIVSNSTAQYMHFDKISTQEGDVNLSVRQILQDKLGFIWLATFNGVYRYEGDEFIVHHSFRDTKQINPDITSLLQDEHGNIWIGTNDGLHKYSPETGELITYRYHSMQQNSIGSNKIRSLAINSKGQIFVGTYDKGLFLYNDLTDRFTTIDLSSPTSVSPKYIREILFEDDDKIWLGTLSNGLYCFTYENGEPQSIVNYREESRENWLSNNRVYTIYKDIDGTIIAGTRSGLNIFDSETKKFSDISSKAFLPGSLNNIFRSVLRDKNGKLWLGTWGGLILCDSFSDITNKNCRILRHDRNIASSLSNSQIMDVYQDLSGVVWLGTENGLNRYDPYIDQFKPLHGEVIDNISEQTVTDFCATEDGLLMLTLADGLLIQKEGRIENYFKKELPVFQNEKFYSLFVDSDQNIWAGSNNGLLIRSDAFTKEITTYKHSEERIPIYSIAELDENILAIGTYGEGLKYFDIRKGTFRQDRALSRPVQINDVFIDTQKRLWVASILGIFKNDLINKVSEYYLPDNPDSVLAPNIFYDIVESENGKIYVGGRNGLYFYDEEKNLFRKKTARAESELWITNLAFDSKQSLWMNLNFNRLANYDRINKQYTFYYANNGIRSNNFNQRGFFIDKNDHLFVSGMDQIFEFNASAPLLNDYSPSPVFTKLLINNIEIHPGLTINKQQILNKDISVVKEIRLNHLNKNFALYFSSFSNLNAKKNRFSYILHGYDQDWQVGTDRFARYSDLPSGNYVFEVFSENNEGIRSDESAVLNIRILSTPLLSPLAFFLYFISLVFILIIVWQAITARIRLKQELLIEKVKRDKEEKFNEERIRFYTNISHELRTPLTLIMGPAKQLTNGTLPSAERDRLHRFILNNSQRLLSLVNQLLDFRKSVHQGMKLKVTENNLVEIIESNIEAFAYMAEEKNIRIIFNSSEKKLIGWFDRKKLDIILFNILSNAFKYGQENSVVSIDLMSEGPDETIENDHIEIGISNTGDGIPLDLQEKVFTRFYQVQDPSKSRTNTGTGIGLALVKNMVELHHGSIEIESIPGKTTKFTVSLPKNKTDYAGEEIFDFAVDADRRTKELIEKVQKGKESPGKTKHNSDGKKILLIEDNPELKEYLSAYLTEDYNICTASDGEEGLLLCKTENPDLVISDVMMERMDGVKFCKELKSIPEISHIPVILMTALSGVENIAEGYKTGADDYITKPFDPELLKIRVNNILEKMDQVKVGFKLDLNITGKELAISRSDEVFLDKVMSLIRKNLDNPDFDIADFSRSLNISSSQLYRKVKGITGISPNEFIRTCRLREASKLILETNLSMSEIAYSVGFNDSLYFSKCFKKQFGVAPSKYAGEG